MNDRLRVSNTSGKAGAFDRVTVRRDGVVVAKVELRKRNPLGYLRQHPASLYTLELRRQLHQAGIDDEDADRILEPQVRARSAPQPVALPTDLLSIYWYGLPRGDPPCHA